MKFLFLLSTVFIFYISSAQPTVVSKTAGPLELVELGFGLASVGGRTTVEEKATQTSGRGWLEDFAIIKVADSVQMVRKANFGVVYMIKAKDTVDINVQVEWIYPEKIINDKGEKFKSIR